MNASTGHTTINRSRPAGAQRKSKKTLPALLLIGSGLVAGSAAALELGDIKVESKLGQPLRASVAYALNPGEKLFNDCIFLRPGVTGIPTPSLSMARISVTAGRILLTGSTPIREPLLGLRLTVNCPYTAQLAREYTLMIDPGLPPGSPQLLADADPAPLVTPVATVAVPQASATVQAVRPIPTRAPTRALVSPAKTNTPPMAGNVAVEMPADHTDPGFATDDMPAESAQRIVATPVAGTAPVTTVVAALQPVVTRPAALQYIAENIDNRRRGDNITDGDASFPPAVQAVAVAGQPGADTAVHDSPGSWLIWLGGAGLAALLGLALFYGRRIKERLRPGPVNDPAEQPDDDLTDEFEAVRDLDPVVADVDATQNFTASAATTGEVDPAVDFELPEEAPQEPSADVVRAGDRVGNPLLDGAAPSIIDANADCHRSMNADASAHAPGGDVLTAQDLQAIQMDVGTDNSGEFTLNDEVDIRALEQDYQEEYSATLSINEEIQQAVIDLTVNLGQDDSSEVTKQLPDLAEIAQTATESADDTPTEVASLDYNLDDLVDPSVNPQATTKTA